MCDAVAFSKLQRVRPTCGLLPECSVTLRHRQTAGVQPPGTASALASRSAPGDLAPPPAAGAGASHPRRAAARRADAPGLSGEACRSRGDRTSVCHLGAASPLSVWPHDRRPQLQGLRASRVPTPPASACAVAPPTRGLGGRLKEQGAERLLSCPQLWADLRGRISPDPVRVLTGCRSQCDTAVEAARRFHQCHRSPVTWQGLCR